LEDADIEERGGPRETSPLCEAVCHAHEEVVQLLLENGEEVSARSNDGYTPLHCAALICHEALVLVLLAKGAEVSARSTNGLTPLHCAALCGTEPVARVLLQMGADLQSTTDDGRTAEDIATARLHPQVAAMLKVEAERREAVRRARRMAFAMGHHERPGAGSRVRWLDAGVLRMVLEQV
jgi:ankyrin repeat protein